MTFEQHTAITISSKYDAAQQCLINPLCSAMKQQYTVHITNNGFPSV